VTCRDFASFILDYLENELDGTTRATFEHHLSTCPNCACYLAQYCATVTIGRRAFRDPAGTAAPFVPEDLIGTIIAAGGL
jgi:anti-sigma factor RsiW